MKTLFFICTVIVVISSDNAWAQQKSTVIDNAKTVFFRDKHQNLSVSTDGGTTWRQLGKTDMTDEEAQQDQTNPLSIAPNPATQAAELSFMMDEKATAEILLSVWMAKHISPPKYNVGKEKILSDYRHKTWRQVHIIVLSIMEQYLNGHYF
ncbi:MAG TPA: hypothetical protein PLW09_16570 [Candidatus Kapabacteria bacterium]|nr:hypothetical protein [Candidatus Kapabacteria bacterium]